MTPLYAAFSFSDQHLEMADNDCSF